MKKNKAFLFIALILVVAMSCCLFVGCKDNKPTPGGGSISSGGGTTDGKEVMIGDVDCYLTVEVESKLADISSLVTVTDQLGVSANVSVQATANGKFKVYPPTGGYTLGNIYKMSVGEGVSFVKYPNVKTVKFSVVYDIVNNTKMNGDVIEYSADKVINKTPSKVELADGTEHGQMSIQTNGLALNPGTVFVVAGADGKKEAYKVDTASAGSDAVTVISYVKPTISEVYKEFEVRSEDKLNNNSDVTVNTDTAGSDLDNSQLATDILKFFGSKPEFKIDVKKVDDTIKVFVTITVPNVVTVEGFGSTSLVITVENDMSAVAATSVFKIENGLEYDLKANIFNSMTCTVSLGSNAAIDKVQNAQELYEKLVKLANESNGGDEVAIPLFKWVLPLADGAVSINYDADLVFRFAFSGSFDVAAKATLNYTVGSSYNQTDGLKTIANTDQASIDSVKVSMQGKAQLKVGVIQKLGLDILGGVAGVRLTVELGNYNRLYGAAQSNNLIDEQQFMVGGVYFEGGFYYDLDLTFALKIGTVVNLNQKVDIVAGEKELYNAGNRELILDLVAKPNASIDSFTMKMPTYQVKAYDLVTGSTYERDIEADKLTFTLADSADKVGLVGDVMTVLAKEAPFNATVSVSVTGTKIAAKDTLFKYTGALVFANSEIAFDKAKDITKGASAELQVSPNVAGQAMKVTVAGAEVASSYNNGMLTISGRDISKVESGKQTVEVTIGDLKASANITIVGAVGLYDVKVAGSDVYDIYTADQVLDMVAKSADQNFAGKIFSFSGDIDMRGAEIVPIKEFAGVINANNHKISNYSIKAMNGDESGFIINNNGTIDGLVLDGKVSVVISGKTNKTYTIGGVVAKNNGTMTNVTFNGEISVETTSILTAIDYKIGGVAGTSELSAIVTDCKANAKIAIVAKFDIFNADFFVGGITSSIKSELGEITAKCTYGALKLSEVNYAK